MPMEKEELFGTNEDGSKNEEYCMYCFKEGKFTLDLDLEQFTEKMVEISQKELGLDEQKAREMAEKTLPTLKRWKIN